MKNECFSLDSDCEFFGSWWLPSNPEIKIPGQLKFKAGEGIELLLEDSFEEMKYEVIYGFASGYSITLIDSFSLNDNQWREFVEYSPCKIISNRIYVGVNYEKSRCERIRDFSVDFGSIRKWTEVSGFQASLEKAEKIKYLLQYEFPDPVTFLDNDDINITLISHVEGISAPLPEIVTIAERSLFKINSKISANSFDFLTYTDGLRKFLTLASRTNIDYNSIAFSDDDNEGYILFTYPVIKIQYPSQHLGWRYSFFTLPMVESKISHYFRGWIDFYSKSPESSNLYFYGSDCLTSLKFLSIAQSLEEFYRDALAITEKDKTLGYANIIKKIYDRYPAITKKFNSDSDTFSKVVLNHRDYFSHWFDKKKNLILEGLEFDILRRDINLLLEMCFLEQCGFSIDEVQNMVEKCIHYEIYIKQR